ncbi:MAG: polyprenyl synthetase family protein [Armatimonadetes bacterium]|nr:polyprenyl synthetase family protein [Armatimonadota bacterium]
MRTSAFFETVAGRPSGDALEKVFQVVATVEDLLQSEMRSDVESVEACCRQTLKGGGKRLRPALAVMAARATGGEYDSEAMIRVAAALEMIHMATLVHDDVIDGSDTRRGLPTASAIYGNTAAILSGDVLLSKAMRLLAENSTLEIIQMVSQAVVEMAEGEVRELEMRGDFDLDEEDHFKILEMKTAAFIEVCCRVGARMSAASEEAEEAIGLFGQRVGMAFQIADDLLDYRGDESKTGKPAASDFRDGQATLPLILLRPMLTDEETEFARTRFGDSVSSSDVDTICSWMDKHGVFERAADRAQTFVDESVIALDLLPTSPDRELLSSVAHYIVERDA